MPTYRKKTKNVQAIEYMGDPLELHRWMNEVDRNAPNIRWYKEPGGNLEVLMPTPEGDMKCHIYDYVVHLNDGEFYPVKEEVFNDIYELV